MLEVHIGKSHSDILQFVICEHEADNLEALETHLFTCEVFSCNHCKLKMKDLKNMKEHIIEEHEGGNGMLCDFTHTKMDSNDFTEVGNIGYFLYEV